MNYKQKGEGDCQRVLKVEHIEGGLVEFTYLEVNDGKVTYTHSIKIETSELVVLQKMLEVT